jgi:hypothetical protein
LTENVNHALVRFLEHALAGAKAGQIPGGAVVLVDTNQQFHVNANAGNFQYYAAMIAGAAVLETQLIASMLQMQQHNANRILRANMPAPTTQ